MKRKKKKKKIWENHIKPMINLHCIIGKIKNKLSKYLVNQWNTKQLNNQIHQHITAFIIG